MIGQLHWYGGRTFVPVIEGRSYITGLVIEADGLHALKLAFHAPLTAVQRQGEPYPCRMVRANLRRLKGATEGAERLRKRVLKEVTA